MSDNHILKRCWISNVSILVLLLIGFGCGPSPFQKQFSQWQDSTKKQHKAADVQAALTPFFADTRMLTNPLPKEVTSLPIFADDPTDVHLGKSDCANGLLLTIGGGFGHWGLLVVQPGHDKELCSWHRARVTLWEDGVYFFRD